MAFVSLKAWRARSAERAALAAKLKRDVAAALALDPEDAVTVNEIACPDPGCPDLETIVLVMRVGEPTHALRIRRTIDAVTPADLEGLVAEERALRAPKPRADVT
ncbi:hypothetical protein [Methylobacterium dankookense]|uniref:Nitrate reductase n=1 Tax=Methylobacterium dankookense TaxID=560405 RepID=A0A564FQP3_9HYPH|nr:hypothetical protein [Methylobacterium dankookense]GJD59475.1 hypothetical protein IFDJLNFL_5403 [Methylobacterium dankookense]VUF10382.1 hypothetical protein MTDSW087_00046 [Methylobacterium dankookense]